MAIGLLRASTALALCIGLVATAHGTTITVNSTADSLAVDGNCTLREAIIAANTDTAVDACPAGNGADVVVVPAGTYTLTLVGAGEDAAATGDLDVTADLEIDGAGAAATIIDGNATDRVLDIDPAGAGLTVLVSGVTLQNGSSVADGGAVRSRATLTMADSVVQASAASSGSASKGAIARGGGIASDGALRVERCSIHDNNVSILGLQCSASGGGMDASGALDVIDSTIADNRTHAGGSECAAEGAGINSDDLTMAGSTVSGNAGSSDAAGTNVSIGGGLRVANATIRNSTVSGNVAFFGGGIVPGSGATLTLLNATVAGNNDGVEILSPGVTLVLRNTIVSSAPPFSACSAPFGDSFTTVGDDYNIDSDNSCGLSGTDIPGVDPLLAPLADNGGPTFTHALFTGSPAIDAGNPAVPGSGGLACEATDQRGVARPIGARCDIGAFEGSVTITTTTTTTTSTTTLCPLAPSAACQPAEGGKAKLTLKVSPDAAKQRLSWKWVSSAAVPEGDFENPVTGANGYTLCVYDQTGRRLDAAAPPGGVCGRKPCWKQTSSGFVYNDALLGPDGLQKVGLKAGPAAGKARITVTGKGANLRMPTLPLTLPVRVQLTRDLTPTCWDTTFSTSSRNTAAVFTAKSDP
jgi:CSLREA domain-containing protein